MDPDSAPAGDVPLASNPMLLVFLDLSIEEIEILCRVERSREPLAPPRSGSWLGCLLASLKSRAPKGPQ